MLPLYFSSLRLFCFRSFICLPLKTSKAPGSWKLNLVGFVTSWKFPELKQIRNLMRSIFLLLNSVWLLNYFRKKKCFVPVNRSSSEFFHLIRYGKAGFFVFEKFIVVPAFEFSPSLRIEILSRKTWLKRTSVCCRSNCSRNSSRLPDIKRLWITPANWTPLTLFDFKDIGNVLYCSSSWFDNANYLHECCRCIFRRCVYFTLVVPFVSHWKLQKLPAPANWM
jgi:hypothetical protein